MSLLVLNKRPLSFMGDDRAAVPRRGRLSAMALISGTQPGSAIRGVVRFYESGETGCIVETAVEGLPAGSDAQPFLGFHVHENGSCADHGDAAGAHFNPQNRPHGFHAGDLPALLNAGGIAESGVYTDRFTPERVIGRSVIIHAMPDDYHTQPSGSSGARIACGVIERV